MSLIKSGVFKGFWSQKVGFSASSEENPYASRLPKRQQLVNIADEFIGLGKDLVSSSGDKAQPFLNGVAAEQRFELDRKIQKVICQGIENLDNLHSYARNHSHIGKGDPSQTVRGHMKKPAKTALKDLNVQIQSEVLSVNKRVAQVLLKHLGDSSREQIERSFPLKPKDIESKFLTSLDDKVCSDEKWSEPIYKELSYDWKGKKYSSRSQITCLNSGVASIIKRNRSPQDAKMINFHSTKHFLGDSPEAVFSATRGGSISEFHQKDEGLREQANLAMAKELIKHKVSDSLGNLSKAQILEKYSAGNPLEVDVQVTSLMTPDAIRHGIRRIPFFGKYFSASNDEAAQLKEEERALKQAAKDKFVTLEVNNEKVKVPVKVNMRLWNIGLSKLSYGQESWFLRPQGIKNQERLNYTAYALLKSKVDCVQNEKSEAISNLKVPSKMKNTLEAISTEKKQMREEILRFERRSKRVKKRFSLIFKFPIIGNYLGKYLDKRQEKKIAPIFKKWQGKADEFVRKVEGYKAFSSGSKLKYLELMQEKEDITDLYSDVQELYGQKIYRDFQKLKENRYTLVATLNALSFQLGENPHFHCKSGRDRTGGTDMEIRVKYEARRLKHRFLSYRENRHSLHAPIREAVVLDSGNIDEVPLRAGRRRGLKNKNCPSPKVSRCVDAVARGIAYCYPI